MNKHIENISEYAHKYFPETKEELIYWISEKIKAEGDFCDLNDIDVSKIKDMSGLFYDNNQDFNGDISYWNVENVENMSQMFSFSKFNNDISKWNVKNVNNMNKMFEYSKFNQDISSWNVESVKEHKDFCSDSPLENHKEHFPKFK